MRRLLIIGGLAALGGALLWRFVLPFPAGSMLLVSVFSHSKPAYWSLAVIWGFVLGTLPLYLLLPVNALLTRLQPGAVRGREKPGKLPRYPEVHKRKHLFVVLGEKHHARKLGPARNPGWLTIPEEGLYTGIEVIGATGSGKCLAKGTDVLMFDGTTKKVEEVAVGDLLMGPDSKPKQVVGTTTGTGDMYRVTPKKGGAYECNGDHVLALRMCSRWVHKRFVPAHYIQISARDFLQKSKFFQIVAKGYRTGVDFPEQDVPLDPYFLGVWLGDGSSHQAAVTTKDREIADWLREFAGSQGVGFHQIDKSEVGSCPTYALSFQGGGKGGVGTRMMNPVINGLRACGVLRTKHRLVQFSLFRNWSRTGRVHDHNPHDRCRCFRCRVNHGDFPGPVGAGAKNMRLPSGEKHIPHVYKANSREVRLRLLAGLIDTDGYYGTGCFDLVFASKRLAEDATWIARSLGFAAYMSTCEKTCKRPTHVFRGTYYRISISGKGLEQIPTKLLRKQASPRRQIKDALVHQITVTPLGPGEYFGFQLDGDGLFLLGDFTVTHNSSCCILPLAQQLLAFQAQDPARKLGGLVTEVKGDLVGQVRRVLRGCGREGDLIELGLDGQYVYNPLHNGMTATALAFNLSTLEKALYGEGKGKDSNFWTQASEDFLSFAIEMHRLLYGYVTLYDLYRVACGVKVIPKLMKEAEETVTQATYVLIEQQAMADMPKAVYQEVNRLKWDPAPPAHFKTRHSDDLVTLLEQHHIEYGIEEESGGEEQKKNVARLEFQKLYYSGWQNTPETTRDNIAIGIRVFLKPFVMDPRVRRLFSPPKGAYEGNTDCGVPLPPLEDLMESGMILALALPKAVDESASRSLGTLVKLDWQRAAELRVPRMAASGEHFRPLVWLADEYQIVATVGGSRPGGDDKFLNLCRAAKVISIVAYQSASALETSVGSDWKTVFSAFQTKVFLRAGDPWTAKLVSDLAGREIRALEHYGISEGKSDAKVSMVTGKLTAPQSTVNMSRSFNLQREVVFDAGELVKLPRGVAIVFAFDGEKPVEGTYCYLKWIGSDPNKGYWVN